MIFGPFLAHFGPGWQILPKNFKICNQHDICNQTVYNMTILGQIQIFGPNGPNLGPKGPNLGKFGQIGFFSEIRSVPFMNTFHHTENY